MDMQTASTLLLLDAGQVRSLLDARAVVDAVEHAFRFRSAGIGRVFPLVRESLEHGAVFGVKSGDVPGEDLLGLKVAGFWPANAADGRDAHQATVMLVDPRTGRPRAVFDGNHVTTMRTGAAGSVGIALLSPERIEQICVFGSGVQAAIQLEFALQARPQVRRVSYLTSSGRSDAAFEARFGGRCDIAHALDADAAVEASRLVITATPSRQPLFAASAVQPGTHINAVGADTRGKRELPAGLLERSHVFVDDRVQAREVGELQWTPGCPCEEIGSLLLQPGTYRRSPGDITVFDMTGIALQDLAVAELLFRRAESLGIGHRIPWPC